MKVIGTHMPAGLGLLAAGTVMVVMSACTAPAAGPAANAESTSASAPASTTAPPSPSASPGTSASVGALVAGFPQKLLPLMPGAKVLSSSFDKASSPATVALVGSVAAKPAAVVAFYTKALEAQGFKAVPGNAVGTVASKDFVRAGNETVNIAVPESAGRSTFTIGANVAPESVK
ncbi:hypothetical protein [Arthrobacter sp. ISL-28]|uniref:hypothetical protein n=1 Tax=Arthrobacter sp. ISL-28 TaxID=2819108 RepID=UPI002889DEAA|nr:hypothetical protein [Arthrobacter sp. ISL-28]